MKAASRNSLFQSLCWLNELWRAGDTLAKLTYKLFGAARMEQGLLIKLEMISSLASPGGGEGW